MSILIALLFATTPHCAGQAVTNCHYADQVSVTLPHVVVWADDRGHVEVYPN